MSSRHFPSFFSRMDNEKLQINGSSDNTQQSISVWEFILSGLRFKYSWIYFSRPLDSGRREEMEKKEKRKPKKVFCCINKIIGPFIICGRITKLIFLPCYGCGVQEQCFPSPPSKSVLSLNRIWYLTKATHFQDYLYCYTTLPRAEKNEKLFWNPFLYFLPSQLPKFPPGN